MEKDCLGALYKKNGVDLLIWQPKTIRSKKRFLTLSTNVRYSASLQKKALEE